ncbi:group II intron reverse transcriptase/maturase, partial [Candidatus Woesearchaeota archaeon]|nr:group II intron reverse transcriptase/maturase [Candidatus Woesearchaeota archaeon]
MNLVCDREWLYQAYRNVAGNKGAQTPGVDGVTLRKWEENLELRMEELRTSLRTGKYRPQPCRRVYIPKKDGKRRPLGITTFRDKIVQEVIRMVIEPIFEADFHQYSFGFRPKRSTQDARAAVRTHMMDGKHMYYVIEGDIKGYFDTVHHKKLMSLIKRRIADKRVLDLIWLFLKAGVMEEGLYKDTDSGVPQGGVISPLLSNIYLHEFDRYIAERFLGKTQCQRTMNRKLGKGNAGYVRYADDWLLFYNGHLQDVRQLKDEIASFLQNELHLTLSPEKTLITHANDGFDFLGFRFYRGIGGDGKWKPKTMIPQNKVQAFKDKVKTLTGHTCMSESIIISPYADSGLSACPQAESGQRNVISDDFGF